MSSYFGNKSSYLSFFRTDVVWVALGQFCAAVTGLLSLKILTNLFNAEQYAYIALMMALSSWIWAGIYLPLNQTLFRYYSIATRDGWLAQFYRQILLYEKKLGLLIVACLTFFLLAHYYTHFKYSFVLLVIVSSCFGIIYGAIQGLAFYFLAQRKRKAVAFIQSTEGAFRLSGGLLAFYLFSKDQYATIVGLLCGGGFVLLYFKQTLLITGLNASVIYLDKWFLFYLIGDAALGKYAVIFTLAITVTSMLYAFFEMVCFPVIFKQQSEVLRSRMIKALMVAYLLANGLLATIVFWFGKTILLFLSSEYVAFSLCVGVCFLSIQGAARMLPTGFFMEQ
jgi:O-antigen/teichoic acid export membrane protein